jgi:hypothetical protein
MAEDNGGGSGVNALAIIAILVLVGVGAWFFLSRQAPVDDTRDIKVDVQLPGSDSSSLSIPLPALA